MEIKRIAKNDVVTFFQCLKALDNETKYMMFEPDERQYNERMLSGMIENQDHFLMGVYDRESIVGFLWAQRGNCRRNRHSAYIVIGIRKAYQKQGIGSKLFDLLEQWAKENHIKRLELTVEVQNIVAIHLYQNKGFSIEGLKKATMIVDGELVDEFMMAKLY